MKKMKRNITMIFLATVLGIGLIPLAGCGGNAEEADSDSNNQTTSPEAQDNTQEEAPEEEVPYQDGMPLTLQANGEDYLVESYEITTNDEGYTVVRLYGPDFEMGTDWRDNVDKYLCFSADCEAGGQSYPALTVGVQHNTSYEFVFESGITPDTITVYPKDAPDAKTTIQLEK